MMAQQISGDIGKRVQEGLKAAGRDVLIESLIDQGEGTILVIVSPIPVDVFAGKPCVGSAGQERPHDHSPSLEPRLEALARDHQSNDSRMVSFDTDGKPAATRSYRRIAGDHNFGPTALICTFIKNNAKLMVR